MILHHKAKRIDNGEEIQGFLTKMWGQYHIMKDNDENTAYPVDEDTIEPCYAELEQGLVWTNDIIFSENLTPEESSKFVWLLQKAKGKIKS
jgi:hypothetical protein